MRPVRDASVLADAVDEAREAAVSEAAADLPDGPWWSARTWRAWPEDDGAVTHYFAAEQGGYRGWRWAVTLAAASPEDPVTVSEVVLIPGPEALVAPGWVPWEQRIRPGDLGVGDLLPAPEDDPRLVPGYVASDDPAVEDVAREIGLGRERVLSRESAASRRPSGGRTVRTGRAPTWPAPPPGTCGTCGFFLPLAGSLRASFGVCGNAYAPADGAVVAVGFGCGAHSDVRVEVTSPVAVAELVYDDGVDLEPAE